MYLYDIVPTNIVLLFKVIYYSVMFRIIKLAFRFSKTHPELQKFIHQQTTFKYRKGRLIQHPRRFLFPKRRNRYSSIGRPLMLSSNSSAGPNIYHLILSTMDHRLPQALHIMDTLQQGQLKMQYADMPHKPDIMSSVVSVGIAMVFQSSIKSTSN